MISLLTLLSVHTMMTKKKIYFFDKYKNMKLNISSLSQKQ